VLWGDRRERVCQFKFIWKKKQTRKFFIKPISGYPIKFSRLSGAEMAELLMSNSQLAFYISSFTDETLIRRKDNKISAGIVLSLFNPLYSCRDIAPTHVTLFLFLL
jgi:hypothetical protein